jgi:hypothetical protein
MDDMPAALQWAIKLWPLVGAAGLAISGAAGFVTGYALLRKDVQLALATAAAAKDKGIANELRIVALETMQKSVLDHLRYIRANMIMDPTVPRNRKRDRDSE